MKKFKSLIIIFIVIGVLFYFFIRKPDEKTDRETIDEVLTESPVIDSKREIEVDFSECDNTKDIILSNNISKNRLKIVEKNEGYCMTETSFEVEGGFYKNDCKVPTGLGKVKFDGGNFDKISQYCGLKDQGSVLLELK